MIISNNIKKNIIIICIIVFFIIQYVIINSNPYRDLSTNKMSILNYIPNNYKPKSEFYNLNKIYKYPFILKPVVCSRISTNVRIIKNKEDLENYFKNNKVKDTMFQEFINKKYEVGLLYECNPYSKNGKIISIVQRENIKRDKIEYQIINNSIKHKVIDRSYLITQKLTDVINNISKKIPNFYVGRFDILFENLNDIKKGNNFYIIEANGTMGFDLRKDLGYNSGYISINPIVLFYKMRWLIIRLYYGILNISKLNCVSPYIIITAIINTYKCKDWEKLFCVYS